MGFFAFVLLRHMTLLITKLQRYNKPQVELKSQTMPSVDLKVVVTSHHFQVITKYMCNTDCKAYTTQLCLGIDSNAPQVILDMLVNGMIYHAQPDFFFLIPAFQQRLWPDFTLKLFVLGRYIITLLLLFLEYNYFP